MLDSSASPNKMRRHARATISVIQQSQDLLLDPAMVAGPVQDPATVALPSCEVGDAEGHDGRRERKEEAMPTTTSAAEPHPLRSRVTVKMRVLFT